MSTERDRLEWWRQRADAQLSPLQEAKDQLRATRLELDAAAPEWKQRYESDPSNFSTHDARREFFVGMQVVLSNAQLTYTFMKDQLCEVQWWITKAGEYRPEMAEQSLREQALMVKFFSVHAMAVTTEETLRAIVRAGLPFTCPPTAELASLVAHVLKVTRLQNLDPLFRLLRLVRNTIHNNGVHRPPSGRDEHVVVDGRSFQFRVGQQLTWMGEDFIPWLAAQLDKAMKQVVMSTEVRNLSACPRLA